MRRVLLIAFINCTFMVGCTTASQHQAQLTDGEVDTLTVAAVQRNIQVGMSGASVLKTLGSPNIISTDSQRNEVWVYDRVGTEYSYSESSGGMLALLGAASGSVAGGAAPSYKRSAGANRRSQKTLTIIIHFDDDQRVEDFSYHASRF